MLLIFFKDFKQKIQTHEIQTAERNSCHIRLQTNKQTNKQIEQNKQTELFWAHRICISGIKQLEVTEQDFLQQAFSWIMKLEKKKTYISVVEKSKIDAS